MLSMLMNTFQFAYPSVYSLYFYFTFVIFSPLLLSFELLQQMIISGRNQ